ncbi:MAG: Abi family protein [Parabacteroides sp.]|nr:Abi family protein [Parabacteroides sp.]
MKTATTIEEQICRLKERGMSIGDVNRASEILLDLGYYRLGFYWFPMERSYPIKDNRSHKFKEGATFDKSVRLYEFDKELRSILSFYLHDIEVNLRTKVVYYVSNEYHHNPFWFLDDNIVMPSFINSFRATYNDETKNNDVISRHHAKHPDHLYAPAWKTLEYMSFGDLIRLIHSLKSSDLRSRLYLLYGFNEEKTFPNYIEIIRQMRNNCAHGHPLFDLKLYKSLRAGKFKRVLIGDQGDLWSSLRGVLLVIQYFLFYLPGQKGIQFSKEIKRLMNRHRKEDIMEFIAYLDDIPWLKERL